MTTDELLSKVPPALARFAMGWGPPRWAGRFQPRYAGDLAVYLLAGDEYVKIGVSAEPRERHMALQQSLPFEINRVRTIVLDSHEAYFVEAFCRVALAADHARGEWYRCSPERASEAIDAAQVVYPTRYPERPQDEAEARVYAATIGR